MTAAGRPIRPEERSGVLHPANLERYGALWIEPDPGVADVVERYWQVRWRLPEDEVIEQHILTLPAVNLSIEQGQVPAPLVVTGVQRRVWMRPIAGEGSVFALRLRPAGLAVLSDLSPDDVDDATVPLTPSLDARLHALLARIAQAEGPQARARAADQAIAEMLGERPVSREGLLANAVVKELSERPTQRGGAALAKGFGVSERAVQRALKHTLGRGPKWVGRAIRLQEVARALSSSDGVPTAELALALGYVDQAHLVNDFRRATGLTPAAYVRSLKALVAGS